MRESALPLPPPSPTLTSPHFIPLLPGGTGTVVLPLLLLPFVVAWGGSAQGPPLQPPPPPSTPHPTLSASRCCQVALGPSSSRSSFPGR